MLSQGTNRAKRGSHNAPTRRCVATGRDLPQRTGGRRVMTDTTSTKNRSARRRFGACRTGNERKPRMYRDFQSDRCERALSRRTRTYNRQTQREARYCEYRSQWTFPSSSPTLPIWTNSSSEHPRAHLSHCCFLPKSRAHASAPANTIWPLRAFTPALIPSASLLLGSEVRCRQSSKYLQMFFGLLHAA